MLLRHYYEIGVGERSKIAGSIVTDQLIDVIQNRYIALGGKMRDLNEVDPEFDEAQQD
tara:strand:+ start:526 stop:699 length:174 start_codon:yes stop_codon:yes gene_type:complete